MEKWSVEEWLDAYGRAWADGDPEQITQLFSEEATYRDSLFDAAMKGWAAIRQNWQNGAAAAQESVTFAAQV